MIAKLQATAPSALSMLLRAGFVICIAALLCQCTSDNFGGTTADASTDAGAGETDTAPELGDPYDPGSPCTCNYAAQSNAQLICSCPSRCADDRSCPISCADGQCTSSDDLLDRCREMVCEPHSGTEDLRCTFSECPDPATTCEGTVELLVDQVQVIMPNRTVDSGTLRVSETGWYDLFNTVLAESGSSQMNETAYFRVPKPESTTNPEGYPRRGNCGQDWIIVDSDNEETPEEAKFVGTFWLEEGDNELVMYHYCPLYVAGTCEWFHIDTDPGNVCGVGVQSVHFKAEGTQAVCVTPVI